MANSSVDLQQDKSEHAKTALAIAITSGKGGVGKTNLTTNLGIALAKGGHKVCIFDADTSLANINILLGLTPEFTLEQFFNGEKNIEEILLTGPENVKIIPSASGIAEFAELQEDKQSRIVDALRSLEKQFDYILIDTAAGIGENVINFLQSAQYAVVVISPEPTSLTDAFSLVKVLQRRQYDKPIYTLVNMAKDYKHSMDVFKRFSQAVNKYIHLKVRYLGYIPMDQAMRSAVAMQSPVVVSEPHSSAARCVTLLSQILVKHFKADEKPESSISSFWTSQISHNQTPLSSIEVAGTLLASNRDGAEIISAQQDKETRQILALTNEALNNQEFSQTETEDLLAHTLENYLIQFGTLPQQAIDLVIQAHAQNQLPTGVNEQLAQHLPKAPANDEANAPTSSPEINSLQQSGTAETTKDSIASSPNSSYQQPAQVQQIIQPQQSGDSSGGLKQQIDKLVEDAIRTKKQLAELSVYLKDQYQALYSDEQPIQDTTSPTASQTQALRTPATQKAEDLAALKQSIRYASAVDQKSKF